MEISILGQNIKHFRKAKGISAYRLAKESNVGGSTISQIENGQRQTLNSDTLVKIAEVLNISVNDLLNINDNTEYESNDLEEILNLLLADDYIMIDSQKITSDEKKELQLIFKIAISLIKEKRKK